MGNDTEQLALVLQQTRKEVDLAWRHRKQMGKHLRAAQKRLQPFAQSHNFAVLTSLGAVCCDLGEFETAWYYLNQVVEQGSKDRHAYFNLAVASINIDKYRPQATALFNKASKLAPSPQTWTAYFDPHGY